MKQMVIISENQQASSTDGNRFGQFPRDTFDNLIVDTGPGFSFTGFSTAITATNKTVTGAGTLYGEDGKMFFNDDAGGTELDYTADLPSVGKRWVALVAWGIEQPSQDEPRTFVTNAQTRQTESRPTATISVRHANIQKVPGNAGADPQKPTVPSNFLVFAWVLLNTTQAEEVDMEENNRATSLAKLLAEVNDFNCLKDLFGQQLDALATLLANLAERIGGLATMDVVLRLIVDVTRLKEKADLPDTYSAWGSDYFL